MAYYTALILIQGKETWNLFMSLAHTDALAKIERIPNASTPSRVKKKIKLRASNFGGL